MGPVRRPAVEERWHIHQVRLAQLETVTYLLIERILTQEDAFAFLHNVADFAHAAIECAVNVEMWQQVVIEIRAVGTQRDMLTWHLCRGPLHG